MLDARFRRFAEEAVPLPRLPTLLIAALLLGLLRPHDDEDVLFAPAGRGGLLPGLEPFHQPLGLLGADEGALDSLRLALAGRQEEHVAVAEQRFGAVAVEDGPAVHLGGDPEGDPTREIRLDKAGDDVHRGPLGGEDEVDPDGAGLLRQHRERGLHLRRHGHHEVGELVHDDHQMGKASLAVHLVRRRRGRRRFGLRADRRERRRRTRRMPERLPVVQLPVEVGEVAGAVGVQLLIAAVHLVHRPLEHPRGLVVVGDHRMPEVRQGVVHRQLDHFRIDHQHPEIGRGVPVDEPGDDGIDRHRLARAGRAGDEQVGHPGQVGDHRLPLQVPAQRHRHDRSGPLPVRRLQQLAESDHSSGRVRHLDADRAAARNRRDPDAHGAHRDGEVVGETDDPPGLHTRRGDDLELGHHRPAGPSRNRPFDLERAERVQQGLAQPVELSRVGGAVLRLRGSEKIDRRQEVVCLSSR